MPLPFRIFVLDNDQTTGDYRVLFYWIEWFRQSRLAPYISRAELLDQFISICESNGVFRPGLRQLLRQLSDLKMDGYLDYFVIYTNQAEILPLLIGHDKKAINVPRLLADMYKRLANDEELVDLTLVRPHELDESSQFIPKRYSRVFEGLEIPKRRWNARYTLFFDDMDTNFIYDDDVLGTGRAHVKVPPYLHNIGVNVLLDLCIATLAVAAKNGAPRNLIERSYVSLHDSLTNYKMNEQKTRDSGGGLGQFMRRLDLYKSS